ncbi:MAG: hypothetical protein ACRELA_03560 [Candidatus Rokuibacteriota bacterium]
MRRTFLALVLASTLASVQSIATGAPGIEDGWLLVAEAPDGEVVVREITRAEMDHAPPFAVDESCGGIAPATVSCAIGPLGPFTGLGHGFMVPHCAVDASEQECFVGTLESKLVGDGGAVRTLRWNRAVVGPVSVVNVVTAAFGGWPLNQGVTQECASYVFSPAQEQLDPTVPGGAGSWLCFMAHTP